MSETCPKDPAAIARLIVLNYLANRYRVRKTAFDPTNSNNLLALDIARAISQRDEAYAKGPKTADGFPIILGMNCYAINVSGLKPIDCGVLGMKINDDESPCFTVFLRDTDGNEFDELNVGVWADRHECERSMRKARPDNPDDDDPAEPLREEKQ